MHYDRDRVIGLLKDSRDAGATDLHLKVPGRPRFRVDGRLVPTPYPMLTPDSTFQIARVILELASRELALATVQDEEVAFGIHRMGRFRARLYRQRGSIGIIVHRMALDPPSLHELKAPSDTRDRVWGGPGLVLVTAERNRLGLLAALTDAYNQTFPGYLISLEAPMEYLHTDAIAAIAQREVPGDTSTVAEGLRAALYADCDAIVTTDLPDEAAAELALRIAENGRTVVAGLAGCRGEEALRWFKRLFPLSRKDEIKERLERVLRLVIWQEGEKISNLVPVRRTA